VVCVYALDGNLLHGVASRGSLAAPWGLALAPATFGRAAGDLLVGNFGNGFIHAYKEMPDGSFKHDELLRDTRNNKIQIEGLWALQFARGGNNGTAGTLYFTAGPALET